MKKVLISLFVFLSMNSVNFVFSKEADSKDAISINEASEDSEVKQNKFASFFVGAVNFFKNMPFSLDIGTEGALNGTNTYFSGNYNWSENLFTHMKLEIQSTLDVSTGSIFNNEMSEATDKNYSVQFFPLEKNIFLDESKSRLFTCGLGLNLSYEKRDTDVTGTAYITDTLLSSIKTIYPSYTGSSGAIVQMKLNHKANLYGIGPLVRLYFKIPLNKLIIFNSETHITPIQFILNKQEASLTQDFGFNTSIYENKSYSGTDWTNTTINQSIHLDFLKFAAFVINGSYTHQHLTEIMPYITSIPECEVSIDTFKIKVGVCLINVGKTFVRFKTGFFYEHEWNSYEYNIIGINLDQKSNTGRFSISLGINY